MSANNKQIAGTHYKQFKDFEPWDVVQAWGLGYLDGTALKYIARWRHKNGIEDLRKSIHFLEKLIETELAGGKLPLQLGLEPRADNGTPEVQGTVNFELQQPAQYCTAFEEFGATNPHDELNTTTIIRGDRGSY